MKNNLIKIVIKNRRPHKHDMVDHCNLGFIDDKINYTVFNLMLYAFLHFKMTMCGISCSTLFKKVCILLCIECRSKACMLFFNILFRKDTIS